MKRQSSRFSTDELNTVINNWELIVEEYNGSLKIKKTTVDKRGLVTQVIFKENVSHLYFVLHRLEISIPYKGGRILIQSGETKPPLFEYSVKNSKYTFSIRDEDLFDKFAKLFGTGELQVGDTEFDNKYFLETNDNKFLEFFLDYKIRNWLNENQIAYFDLNSQKAKNKISAYLFFDELNTESIKHQVEIFKYCIERLNNAL